MFLCLCCIVALRCYVACTSAGACTSMNRILIRGGLSRAPRCSGSPLVRAGVRYQSSEEVAQERQAEDDDVEAGNTANTLAGNGPTPLQQARGSSASRRKGVAPPPRPYWYNDDTNQPRNGLSLNGGDHFSRSGRVAASRPAAAAAAVSAPDALRGPPNGSNFSPLSRVNGELSPAAYRDWGRGQIVNGAGQPTLPVSRNVSARLGQRGQNNNNHPHNRDKGSSKGSWNILLNLEGGGAGGNGAARLRKPRVVDEVEVNGSAAAARRSDPLRPYPVLNGASILTVCTHYNLCSCIRYGGSVG